MMILSRAHRRHRLSWETNVAYLVVGGAVLVIATVLWLALANGATHGNDVAITENQETNQSSTRKIPNTNTIVDAEMIYRLDFVRNMTRDAWTDLLQFHSSIGLTNSSQNRDHYHEATNQAAHGFTLMQSLSTLWLTNLSDEYAHAKTWIKPLSQYRGIFVANAVTQYVGSVASCYALTGDEFFLNLAKNAVKTLKPLHDEKGLPFDVHDLNRTENIQEELVFRDREHYLPILAPFLEYRYMADLTHDSQLDTTLSQYRSIVKSWPKTKTGLYTFDLADTKRFRDLSGLAIFSHHALFYSYVLKSYIQSNYTDHESNSMFNQAIEALDAEVSEASRRTELSESDCYLGAVFGLSAWAKNRLRDHDDDNDDDAVLMKKHWNWAVHFTEKCRNELTVRNFTVWLADLPNDGLDPAKINLQMLYLDPSRAECYFVLYRLTRDPKYRQYAWELTQYIQNFRTEVNIFTYFRDGGYIVKDWYAYDLIGTTLKYLYLTFVEENLLSLDEWVFNGCGQPLPICGRNRMYPGEKCGRKDGH